MFDTRGRRELDRALLRRMNDSLAHRGPDGEGEHHEPGVALGHRRLSIIDIATGQQPLYNEDGSVVVVFNGEIYNYQELIPELQALGTRLPHAQRHRSHRARVGGLGRAVRRPLPRHVRVRAVRRGRETLFLARDRLGVKPLFYSLSAGRDVRCSVPS